MKFEGIRAGFAMTGSFCTFSQVLPQIEKLCLSGCKVTPIMSECAASTDTRFGKASDFIEKIEEITGEKIIKTIKEAEPIGPRGLLDILIVAPCTGNSMAKIANGICDSSVTMAAKAHLRNGRPILIAPSSNDALSGGAKNIGALLNMKNVFFVPFGQDDCIKKPTSLVAKMEEILPAMESALLGKQIQPILK